MAKSSFASATAKQIDDAIAMIGAEKAKSIIDYRDAGKINSAEDLTTIPGISKKLADAIEMHFDFGKAKKKD